MIQFESSHSVRLFFFHSLMEHDDTWIDVLFSECFVVVVVVCGYEVTRSLLDLFLSLVFVVHCLQVTSHRKATRRRGPSS